MRFVFFTTNLAGGGAEKALAKIAAGLSSRGHTVDFLVCEDKGDHPPPPGCGFQALSRTASHGWFGKRRLAWSLRRRLGRQHYDLLVSTLPFADEIAALARLPRHVCRIANTLSAEIARLPTEKAARRRDRYLALYGRRSLVAVSQGVATDLAGHFAAQARVIANPFDVEAIRRRATEPSKRPSTPYVLHVGRHAAQKRHDLLLDAFACLETSHHLVLLTPPDPELRSKITARGLEHRVVIAGFQANPYPWMAGADLLVLCSDHEGLPNVLIEALACGTRIVSTDCPSGPREILVDELAVGLVPCGDPKALAYAMAQALARPRPDPVTVASALAPYDATRALDAWEALAEEIR